MNTTHDRKPRRSAAQLARDRRRIAELYLEGKLQVEIAEVVNLSQSTVSNDIKALQKQWIESALIDFNEAKSQELARIDKLEREYYQAWHRSCEDAETIKQKGEPGEGTKVKTESVERTVKGQAGDPRFLQGVQWCIDRRCKILGIDAAIELKHTGVGRDGAILVMSGNVQPKDF